MAIWNPTNFVITKTGQEILNKLAVGGNKLTISRIAVASGRVDASTLANQTALTTEKGNCEIKSTSSTSEGSAINVGYSNEGVTESFEINQIGVFVTHPEYTGEQLYMILQCDEGTGDAIPKYADTPILVTYGFYVTSGKSSTINVNVSLSGYALATDLQLKRNKFTELRSTLYSSNWSNGVYSFETQYPNTEYNIEIELSGDSTLEQYKASSKAKIVAVMGTNTFKSLDKVPTIDIPVILRVEEK